MDMDTDVDADAWLVLPAALFTLLALLTAALFLNKKYVPRSSREEHKPTRPQGALASCTGHGNTARSQELHPGEETESQSRTHTVQNLEEDLRTSQQTAKDRKCETVARNESGDPPSVERVDQQEPLRYRPGMLRTSQLEKMMSREELEEERRVQQEQLAAIFKLLKENQDTFGEISENDMEEQLRLYSI